MRHCAEIPILALLLAAAVACHSAPRPAPPLAIVDEPPAIGVDAAPRPATLADHPSPPTPAQLDQAMAGARAEADRAVARAAATPFTPLAPSYTVQPGILEPRGAQRDRVEWGLATTSATIALTVVDAHYEPPVLSDLRGAVALLPSQTGVPLFTYSAAIENFMLQRNAINDNYNFYIFGKLVIQVAARNVTKEQWNKTVTLFVFDDTGRLMKSESVTQYFRPNQTIFLRYEYPNTPRFARWMMRVSD